MNSNIETELKMLVSKEEFESITQNYALNFIKQTNTYFDTEDKQLRSRHCSMRIREREGKFLFTCKVPDLKGHVEHECYLESADLTALNQEAIQNLLKELNIKGNLTIIGQLTTWRAVVELEHAELCFDKNEYRGIIDYEIEYEYRDDHDGYAVFNEILKPIHKTYERNGKAKVARACDL